MDVSRRKFLAVTGAGLAAAAVLSPLDVFFNKAAAGKVASGIGYGPLSPKLPEYVVGVDRNGELYRFAANVFNGSEFAGACFSPDGKTLFVNLQSPGITCAIWGPWTRKRS